MKYLIFITDEYPFGNGETFIESEIKFLASEFDSVFIFSRSEQKAFSRPLPKNVAVLNLGRTSVLKKLLLAPFFITNPVLLKELISTPKLTLYKIRTIYNYFADAMFFKKQISSCLKNKGISFEDCVSYSYWFDKTALAVQFLNKYENVKSVSRAHGWDVYDERQKESFLPFRRFLSEKLYKVYFVSKNGKLYLEGELNESYPSFSIARLGIINNAVDFFNRKGVDNNLNIISCSSIIRLKRIPLIAGSLELLCESNPVKWTHIGDGEDLNLIRNKYEKYNFLFLGSLSNKQVFEYYKLSELDLFINLSEYEGIPVSMMEAMSFGIPCIGTDVGGVSEIIEDGYNGFLLPANPTKEEVAQKIEYFNSLSKEEKNRLRQGAFDTWNEKYNAAINYSKFASEIAAL